MNGLKRLVSRRVLTLATHPAAWQALAAKQAWWLRGACTPACKDSEVTSFPITIYWPMTYQHFNATGFLRPLQEGLRKLTRLEPRPIPQPYEGIVILGVDYQHKVFSVAVDYYDYPFVNE